MCLRYFGAFKLQNIFRTLGNLNDDDWHGADNRKQKLEKKTSVKLFSLFLKSRASRKSITLTPKCLKHASHPEDPPVRLLIYKPRTYYIILRDVVIQSVLLLILNPGDLDLFVSIFSL